MFYQLKYITFCLKFKVLFFLSLLHVKYSNCASWEVNTLKVEKNLKNKVSKQKWLALEFSYSNFKLKEDQDCNTSRHNSLKLFKIPHILLATYCLSNFGILLTLHHSIYITVFEWKHVATTLFKSFGKCYFPQIVKTFLFVFSHVVVRWRKPS